MVIEVRVVNIWKIARDLERIARDLERIANYLEADRVLVRDE